MYISNLKLWNFRKYGSLAPVDLNIPNLNVPFKNGINILIGENDSGKTAIIDAIKLVLKTHAYEWIKPEEEDFYHQENKIADFIRIEIEFSGISDLEASNFIEWCGWDDEWIESKNKMELRPKLILIYQAELKNNKIIPIELKAGMDGSGHALTYEAKEYLKCTYLKALRDANSELTAKKNSRLSQILKEHKEFRSKNEHGFHEFEELFNKTSTDISSKFKDPDTKYFKNIKNVVDGFIKSFIEEESESVFDLGSSRINNILEKISLGLLDVHNLGLGTMNRLFMAAELLHLKKENWNGLKLCMIEELEAHLHPQSQLKIMNRLKSENEIQYILTTHSPNITSQANLKDIIICKNNNVYPLVEGKTKLAPDNYIYLERFLDVTKSNLFFSKGNIIVEGWSEEILLPVLAKLLDYDLTAKEISIINVASTAYLHFAKIFIREDSTKMNVPVSIITDLDNKPDEGGNFKLVTEEEENVQTRLNNLNDLQTSLNETDVLLSISKNWTLEWCLYKSCFSGFFKKALKETHPRVFDTFDEVHFIKSLSKKSDGSKIDKVALMNNFVNLLENDETISIEEVKNDEHLAYLVNAIKHVCEYGN